MASVALLACSGQDLRPEDSVEACSNGLDDDGDGLVDCQEPRCLLFAVCEEAPDAGPDAGVDAAVDAAAGDGGTPDSGPDGGPVDAPRLLIGLRSAGPWSTELAGLDPATGATGTIASTPEIAGGNGASAIDRTRGRLYLIGTVPEDATERIITIDVASGAVLSTPPIEAGQAEIEVDGEGRVLGVAAGRAAIHEVDPDTGATTSMAEITELEGQLGLMGGTAIDAGAAILYVAGSDGTGAVSVISVDTTTGQLLAAPSLSDVPHVDGIAVRSDGTLVGLAGPSLVEIDPATGATTGIGPIPDFNSFWGMFAADAQADLAYFIGQRANDNRARIYSVSTDGGELLARPVIDGGGFGTLDLCACEP